MIGRHRPKKASRVLILVILVLGVACQGTTLPTPAESPSSGQSLTILEAVTARQVDSDYAPVNVTSRFSPTDTFYCVIQVAGAEQDAELTAQWYFGDTLITETTYVTEGEGTGYVAFELTNQQPWPEGLYRVDILSAGVALRSVEFRVTK
jgi:hypothetical protein